MGLGLFSVSGFLLGCVFRVLFVLFVGGLGFRRCGLLISVSPVVSNGLTRFKVVVRFSISPREEACRGPPWGPVSNDMEHF